MNDKKGQLGGVPAQILGFVVVVIILSVGALVVSKIGATFGVNTTERNTTDKGLEGFSQYSAFLPTIAIVLVAALIISLIVGAFVMAR